MELIDLKKKKNSITEKYKIINNELSNQVNISYSPKTDHQDDLEKIQIQNLESEPSESKPTDSKPIDENLIESNENVQSKILKPGSVIKPCMNDQDAESLVARLYGITVLNLKELISYDDRNYLIKVDCHVKNPILTNSWPHGYVLKISNTLDSEKTDFIEGQTALMIYLKQQKLICPAPIKNIFGNYYSIEIINGKKHLVRLLEFIPGEIFYAVPKTKHIYYQAGEYVANLDMKLKKFTHDSYATHKSLWQLESVPQLKEFLYAIKDMSRKDIVEEIICEFEGKVLTNITDLEKGIIHGDFNEQNILVHIPKGEKDYKIFGIIDFGDTNSAPIIFELAIAMTYLIIESKDLDVGGLIIAGYSTVRNITQKEKEILKYCVAARFCQSLVMGAYTNTLDPHNEYVLRTQESGWTLLETLWKERFNNIDEIWQNISDKYLTQSVK